MCSLSATLVFNISTTRVGYIQGGAGDQGMSLFQCLFLKQSQMWMSTTLWIAGARPGRGSGHGEEFEVSRERAAHPKHPQRTGHGGQGLSKPPPALTKGQLRTRILSKSEILGSQQQQQQKNNQNQERNIHPISAP